MLPVLRPSTASPNASSPEKNLFNEKAYSALFCNLNQSTSKSLVQSITAADIISHDGEHTFHDYMAIHGRLTLASRYKQIQL